jgi:hypothetical protein
MNKVLTGIVILDTGVEVTILFDWLAGAASVLLRFRSELDLDVVSGR